MDHLKAMFGTRFRTLLQGASSYRTARIAASFPGNSIVVCEYVYDSSVLEVSSRMTINQLCHWCHREIASDQLILIPENYLESDYRQDPRPDRQDANVTERPWHQICFAIVHGADE